MGKIEPEKEIKKVVICYEDGEEKELVCIIEGMMELGDFPYTTLFRSAWECFLQQKKYRKEKRETVKEKEVRCTPEELKELIENLEEGQILEVTFDAE